MLLNIILILFLLFTVYWWGSQGLFSALLHLVVTIVAGALALCFWEPIATLMLGTGVAPMAWAIALVFPFAVALILLRLLSDRLIRGNVQHQPILSWVIGGVFGLFSGVISAGIVVIGLGFMPFTPHLGGVQPYAISTTGNAVVDNPEGGGLWVPVDDLTERFYDYLSRGAFGTATPLARYQPDLAEQAHLSRLGLDENASRVAHPDTVEVASVVAHPVQVAGLSDDIAETLGTAYQRSGYQLVAIETVWENKPDAPTTYDRDATARVFWNQVRLVTDADDLDEPVTVYGPVGITQEDVATGDRVYRPWSDTETFAFSTRKEPLVFLFLIPDDQTPSFVLLRNTRFDLADALPDQPSEPDVLVDAIGALPGSATARDDAPEAPAGATPEGVSVTTALPRPFSSNYAQGIQNNGEGAVIGGQGRATQSPRSITQRTRVSNMYAPAHQRMVRVVVPRTLAHSVLGSSLAAAGRSQALWLSDTAGNRWLPTGYVIDHGRDEGMAIYYGPMENASVIPTHQMTGNDTLYLYFLVSPGVTIDAYHLGDNYQQEANLRIPR